MTTVHVMCERYSYDAGKICGTDSLYKYLGMSHYFSQFLLDPIFLRFLSMHISYVCEKNECMAFHLLTPAKFDRFAKSGGLKASSIRSEGSGVA